MNKIFLLCQGCLTEHNCRLASSCSKVKHILKGAQRTVIRGMLSGVLVHIDQVYEDAEGRTLACTLLEDHKTGTAWKKGATVHLNAYEVA